MDRKIYFRTNADYGVYSARRLPKGTGLPSPTGQTAGGGVSEDAHPAPISGVFASSGLAPHSTTTRLSYIVPARRRFKLEAAHALIRRFTNASSANESLGGFKLIRAGASDGPFVVLAVNGTDNNATNSAQRVERLGSPIDLYEGDELRCLTYDTSTGGTQAWNIGFTGTEYDAVLPTYQAQQLGTGNSVGGSGGGNGGGSGLQYQNQGGVLVSNTSPLWKG